MAKETELSEFGESPNKQETRKPIGRLEKLSPQFKKRIARKVKKKISSTSKILKSSGCSL